MFGFSQGFQCSELREFETQGDANTFAKEELAKTISYIRTAYGDGFASKASKQTKTLHNSESLQLTTSLAGIFRNDQFRWQVENAGVDRGQVTDNFKRHCKNN